jgi:threonine/homoserine/homoserine lactone efflux protein
MFVMTVVVLSMTPGPNMIYCMSRSICQGRAAGLISLAGVALGYAVHINAAIFGLTALLLTVPMVYDAVKFAGAGYLLWMAWQALRPNGASPLEMQALPQATPGKLFRMGFLTNVLNPKLAIFFVSLFPQFIDRTQGNVLMQSLMLSFIQISISVSIDALIVVFAAVIAQFLAKAPVWSKIQRWVMGVTLAGLALRMVLDGRKA